MAYAPSAPEVDTDSRDSVRPRAAIRIGIVGHTSSADEQRIRTELDRCFEMIEKCSLSLVSGARELFACCCEADHINLRLLTCLAPGTDAWAWEKWQRRGQSPAVRRSATFVLPSLRKEYQQELDGNPKFASAQHNINALIDSAARAGIPVSGMEFDLNTPDRHLHAGRFVIRSSDVVIAVWSGEVCRGGDAASGKPAGYSATYQCVRLAIELGIPVLWIQPAGGVVHEAEAKDVAEQCINVSDAQAAVNLCKAIERFLVLPSCADESVPGLGAVLRDRLVQAVRRAAFFWERRQLHEHRGHDVRRQSVLEYYRSSSRYDLKLEKQPIGCQALLWADYCRADQLAAALHKRHRISFEWMYRLGVIAVTASLIGHGMHGHNATVGLLLGGLEIAALVTILLLFIVDHWRRWLHRGTDARRVAELLRQSMWLQRIGIRLKRAGAAHRDGPEVVPIPWTWWYVYARVRELDPVSHMQSEPLLANRSWIESVRCAMNSDWIKHQLEYYDSRGRRHAIRHERTEDVLVLIFLLAAMSAAMSFMFGVSKTLPDNDWGEAIAYALMCFGVILPAIGAAWHGVVSQADAARLSIAYRNMREALEVERQALQSLDLGSQPHLVERHASRAAAIMVSEVEDWHAAQSLLTVVPV